MNRAKSTFGRLLVLLLTGFATYLVLLFLGSISPEYKTAVGNEKWVRMALVDTKVKVQY
jgi:hypothetical protein